MNLYQQELMDHFRHPRNRGTLDNPTFNSQVFNPSCGDQISFQGIIKDNVIVALKFQGKGCVISQATASMLSEKSLGTSIETIQSWTKDTILALIGIPLGPTRLRCALLPLEALHQGIVNS